MAAASGTLLAECRDPAEQPRELRQLLPARDGSRPASEPSVGRVPPSETSRWRTERESAPRHAIGEIEQGGARRSRTSTRSPGTVFNRYSDVVATATAVRLWTGCGRCGLAERIQRKYRERGLPTLCKPVYGAPRVAPSCISQLLSDVASGGTEPQPSLPRSRRRNRSSCAGFWINIGDRQGEPPTLPGSRHATQYLATRFVHAVEDALRTARPGCATPAPPPGSLGA